MGIGDMGIVSALEPLGSASHIALVAPPTPYVHPGRRVSVVLTASRKRAGGGGPPVDSVPLIGSTTLWSRVPSDRVVHSESKQWKVIDVWVLRGTLPWIGQV